MNIQWKGCFSILCLLVVLLPTQLISAQNIPFSGEGLKKIEGVLPVYYDTNKIYLEINENLLGCDMLLFAQLNKGIGLIGRPLNGIGVVRFTKGKTGQICMSRGILSERFSHQTDDLLIAFQNSTQQPVDFVYEVVGVTSGKGYVIDITDPLKQGDDWFECDQEWKLRNQDAQQFCLKEVKAEADGVRFSFIRTYEYVPPVPIGANAYEGFVPLEMGCVLRVLPKEKMRVRYQDARVGYEAIDYIDYGKNSSEAEHISVIQRWRLDRKMNRRIVFYVDASFPVELIPFVTRGVNVWNEAFKDAGYSNVLEVKIADKTVDVTSAKAMISYDFGEPEMKHYLVADPSTGEILACRINVGHGVLAKYLSRYLLQCGNVDVRIRENDEDKKIAGDILQYLISREVGFVLGLKPNFAGHRAFTVEQVRSVGWLKRNGYTASILDENTFNYVVQPEDGVKPEFLLPRLSVYDKWAIEWGYREFPGSQDEESDQKWLNRLFEKKAKKPFYDYVDFIENKGNAGSLELTSDRIEALELGIQNLKGLLQKMSKSENESACRQLMNKGCSQYLQYLSESCVGSVADQKKLLPFWNEYLCCGVPAWLEATDWWEYERQLPENRLLKTGEEIFHRLLSPEGGCDSLVNALQVILFNGFDCQYIPSAFQMNLQRRYLSVFLECVLNESVMASSDDYAGCMLVGLKTLYVKFKKLSSEHSDQLTASHYENLLRVCNKELEAKGARKLLLDL